jgi:hypothetical protein
MASQSECLNDLPNLTSDAGEPWCCAQLQAPGNRRDPAKRVRIRYRVTADRVVAQGADEGAGFDPAAVPDSVPVEYRERPYRGGLGYSGGRP